MWISESEKLFQLPGYNSVFQERKHTLSGGLMIFINETFDFEFTGISSVHQESIKISLLGLKNDMSFLFSYRNVQTRIEDFIEELDVMLKIKKKGF